jgi:hypothetical protein
MVVHTRLRERKEREREREREREKEKRDAIAAEMLSTQLLVSFSTMFLLNQTDTKYESSGNNT